MGRALPRGLARALLPPLARSHARGTRGPAAPADACRRARLRCWFQARGGALQTRMHRARYAAARHSASARPSPAGSVVTSATPAVSGAGRSGATRRGRGSTARAWWPQHACPGPRPAEPARHPLSHALAPPHRPPMAAPPPASCYGVSVWRPWRYKSANQSRPNQSRGKPPPLLPGADACRRRAAVCGSELAGARSLAGPVSLRRAAPAVEPGRSA
jgi:hypothetical protein